MDPCKIQPQNLTTIMKRQRLPQCGALLLLGALLALAGCASSPSSANTVRRSETGRAHTVQQGEVIYVRQVTIEGEAHGAGAVAGGVMGFALGGLADGRGRGVARAGGAVGGAMAGSAIERRATTQTGVEVTVELEDGEIIVIIQAADEVFNKGDSVRVLRRSDGGVRVIQ
jgi:outer membrane lipoprotein SlyB